jgi:hypothetical protein
MKHHPLLVLLVFIASIAGSVSRGAAEIAPAGPARPFTEYIAPPPLNSAIVGMMKTNTFGSVEARIFFVERWDITSVQKAQVLLSMLEKSEPDDQRKLAHAAVKQVANTHYGLLHQYLCNSKLPRPVLSVFMTDTLKRDNRVKMPALLTLAQLEAHPMQAEARELLSVYLGQNHGTNWPKWEEALLAWLKQNPK